ncbi:Stealth CR1 domain-containing protein [Alteromonas facilis]|uniref:Stealth CR1 domain-containing protein n=1 Tax=Alteromonas facilis TaxID=2048004 RepID=UPI000C28C2B9|nr:Stealth CR1 domain-containing protein [Alteromonas facilis]
MTKKVNIDFVIPWVGGNDEAHLKKRRLYEKNFIVERNEDIEHSISDKRFIEADELKYCLRSIVNHAPWYNNIYLLTDAQEPKFLDLERIKDDRIHIIDHKELFKGNLECLPTFNTRSILTCIDKIPNLADVVVIGNDDTFFSSSVSPEFFLSSEGVKVYGEFIDNEDERFQTLHFDALKLSSQLVQPGSANYLALSHGFMPLALPAIKQCRKKFAKQFDNNIQHRFRHRSQFLIEALVSLYMLKEGHAKLLGTENTVHFSFQLCREGTEEKLKFLFELLASGQRTMFCLNDYIALSSRFNWVEPQLNALCGERIQSEI